MYRRLGVVLILVVFGVVLAGLFGCRDDVEVPWPPTLAGKYTGTMQLLRIDGIDTLVDTSNNVNVRFGSESYNIKVIDPVPILFFCSSSGEYELANGVEFFQEEDNLEKQVCTPDDNPTGFFGLDQHSQPGKVLIKQDALDEDGVRSIKTLELELDTN
ncbi:MAG: hypothetical protein JSU65_00235 [Candidatus Zixiibacteriota bacterium]|nr:MAG: hypothetical protein JSU65_00235 [candidate division Zixibacteria bacterium]